MSAGARPHLFDHESASASRPGAASSHSQTFGLSTGGFRLTGTRPRSIGLIFGDGQEIFVIREQNIVLQQAKAICAGGVREKGA